MGCRSVCNAQHLHTPSGTLPTPCKQGRTRTKLGLRDFIALGEFTQSIDTTRSLAVNDIAFSVAGLGMLRGGLRIEAAYTPVSDSRVDIKFQSATLVRTPLPGGSTQCVRSANQQTRHRMSMHEHAICFCGSTINVCTFDNSVITTQVMYCRAGAETAERAV